MKTTFLATSFFCVFLLGGCQSTATSTSKTTHSNAKEVTTKPVTSKTDKPNKPSSDNKTENKASSNKPKNIEKPKSIDIPSTTGIEDTSKKEDAAPQANTRPPLTPAKLPRNRPSDAILQSLLKDADALRHQGKFDQAAVLYRQAQNLNGAHTQSYARLSEIALRTGNAREAERQARMGLAQSKTAAQQKAFWRLIALSLDAQAKKQEASRARYEASRIKP